MSKKRLDPRAALVKNAMRSVKNAMLQPQVLKALRELGRVGGKTRAKNLTAAERREGARKAAQARWRKRRKT